MQPIRLRPATNRDQPQIIELIDTVYREYDDRVNLEGAESDLLDLDTHYAALGGSFVVLDLAGEVVGSHAAIELPPNEAEERRGTFRRLYVRRDLRGQGQGRTLMLWAIHWAQQAGWDRIEFWSDTRFESAHRFFERLGFKKDGRRREMRDGHQPYAEYGFEMRLTRDG